MTINKGLSSAAVLELMPTNFTVRGTTGDVIMPDSIILTGSGAVNVSAGGSLQPGVIDTTGLVSIGTAPGGVVVFNRPVDRKGDSDIIARVLDRHRDGVVEVRAGLGVVHLG